jgi:transcriptional regulator with XRE-family HTH domain
MQNKVDLTKKIGTRVKQLRSESGLSQKKLAESTGLSPALLSRIENGFAMPSITTLDLISRTLKADIGYFFKDDGEDSHIVTHPGSRRVVLSRSKPRQSPAYKLELLAEGMKNPFMEPAIVTYLGRDDAVEPTTHDGQEFMYVLEGRAKLTVGGKDYTLKAGHAAYWNGNIPHRAISLGKKLARSIHVHLIPGRWTGTFQHEDIPTGRSKSTGEVKVGKSGHPKKRSRNDSRRKQRSLRSINRQP